MLKKILVPLDGSELAERAVAYAQNLAQQAEAELVLMRVASSGSVTRPPIEAQTLADNNDLKLAQNYLHDLQQSLPGPVRTILAEGYSEAEIIINTVCQEAIDLIVISTHGHSGVKGWAYGRVTDKVLQQAPCPVFLVRAIAENQMEKTRHEERSS